MITKNWTAIYIYDRDFNLIAKLWTDPGSNVKLTYLPAEKPTEERS